MSTTNSKLFLFAFVVALLCLVAPSSCDYHDYQTADELISDICDQTSDPKFCYRTLTANVKSSEASIRDIAKINVDVALKFVKFVRANIQTLENKSGREPRVLRGYDKAKTAWDGIIGNLNTAQVYANKGLFLGMLRSIYACDKFIHTSEALFSHFKSMHLATEMAKVLLHAVRLEVKEM